MYLLMRQFLTVYVMAEQLWELAKQFSHASFFQENYVVWIREKNGTILVV